jgi:hypothetical protein
MPQPTTPMVIRFEGAGLSSRPNALAGMIVGTASASPAVARKWRRLIPEPRADIFMGQ